MKQSLIDAIYKAKNDNGTVHIVNIAQILNRYRTEIKNVNGEIIEVYS